MEKITIWYRGSNPKTAKHNHIENGWADGNTPTATHESQKHWKHEDWVGQYAYLHQHQLILRGRKFR